MFESIDRTTETSLQKSVESDRLEAHVDALTGLHRYPGTDDQWEAAEYVVDTLESYGVDATIETFEAYTSVPDEGSVTVTSPIHREMTAITTAFSANTPEIGVSADVVYVPENETSAPELAHVEGRVVLTRGLPTPGVVKALDDAGAAAVVFESITPEHVHEMIVSPVWGTPSTKDADDLPSLPVAEVYPDDGRWLRETVAGNDVELTVRTQTTTELTTLPCPIGRIDGTESDRYFLIGNHIDSWYEGVTDNGTAVAATLEIARVFSESPPKRGVHFGFWPGHSMGRYAGSSRYADEHWLDLRQNGVGYLHLDLNGLVGADQLWFQHMAEVETEHLNVLEAASIPLQERTDDSESFLGSTDRPARNSDQSFWGTGLSSMLSGARFDDGHEDAGPVGGGWWWHTPDDTRDKVDLDLLVEEVELYLALTSRFCNSSVLPHDYAATCRDIRAAVTEIDDAADGTVDFTPINNRLDVLEDSLDSLATALDSATGTNEVETDVEDVQVALGNVLIPTLYMDREAYEQEPALPYRILPSLRIAETLPDLTGPKRRFAEISVRRGINRVSHRLDEAIGLVDEFATHEGE